MSNQQEQLAVRSPDRKVAAQTGLTESGAMAFANMEQIMEFGKMMALAGCAIPAHLRDKPGACVAIAIQASAWGMSPFAVAAKTYVVKDIIAYEAQLVNAVILRRAPIVGRFQFTYSGEGVTRRCKVVAKLAESEGGGQVEYESPPISKIPVQNSPLWKGDPDQQLAYYSSRAMCRRHFPDVLLGVYTEEEIRTEQIKDVGPPKPTALPAVPTVPEKKKGKVIEADTAPVTDQEPAAAAEEEPAGNVTGAAEDPAKVEPHWNELLPDGWREIKMPEGGFRAGHTIEVIAQEPDDLGKALQNNAELTGEHGRALACAVYTKLVRFMGTNETEEEAVIQDLQAADESFAYNSLRDVPANLIAMVNTRVRDIIKAAKSKAKGKGK